jgi:hypothetical protein
MVIRLGRLPSSNRRRCRPRRCCCEMFYQALSLYRNAHHHFKICLRRELSRRTDIRLDRLSSSNLAPHQARKRSCSFLHQEIGCDGAAQPPARICFQRKFLRQIIIGLDCLLPQRLKSSFPRMAQHITRVHKTCSCFTAKFAALTGPLIPLHVLVPLANWR